MALIDAQRDKIFHDARTAGVREPSEAYAADALAALADLPHRSKGAAGAETGNETGEAVEDWSFMKLIVRVDLTALDRGAVSPGEVCEIAGQGPIPVADAWRMIDGDAFVAAVTTNGTEIDKVIHLGRKPTVLQKTALEWFSAGECSIDGCTSPARIEIDHVADWADTKITRLPDLASRAVTTTTSRPATATPSARDSPTGNDNSSHPTAPAHREAPTHPMEDHRPATRQRPTRAHPPPRRRTRRTTPTARHHPGRPLRHRLTRRLFDTDRPHSPSTLADPTAAELHAQGGRRRIKGRAWRCGHRTPAAPIRRRVPGR